MKRINYLDGHRGVAILLVVFYHAFSRWTEIVPYGDSVSSFLFFKYGFLGVQLFFLISGFVILMTLERCDQFKEFVYHRWLRLFPAMLICSLFIFFTASFFSERPSGQPQALYLIPGLTFIEPYLLGKLTGIPFESIENAFWSLYVEFKFYIIAAIFYFLFGSRVLVTFLFLCFLSDFAFSQLIQIYDNKLLSFAYSITANLSFKHFGWFAAGAAFYMFKKNEQNYWFIYGVIISVINTLIIAGDDLTKLFALCLIVFFFSFSLINEFLQTILSHRSLLFFGFISYPLYLLHENLMIALVIKMKDTLPSTMVLLLPVIAIAFISIVAWFISKHLEKPIKIFIQKYINSLQRKVIVKDS